MNTDFLLKNVSINSKYIDICCSKWKCSCSIILFHHFRLKWGNYEILKILSFWLKKMIVLKTCRPVKNFNKVSEEKNVSKVLGTFTIIWNHWNDKIQQFIWGVLLTDFPLCTVQKPIKKHRAEQEYNTKNEEVCHSCKKLLSYQASVFLP